MAAGRGKTARNVGRYQLVHELGQSYLGPLWAVRVEGAEGTTGLAMLRLVSLARLDADTRVRLLEAAWQAMEVRDDRICSVTDVVASDGELGIVSDYVEGVTLRSLSSFASVRRKAASPEVALRIALDLLAAVAALHLASAELGDEAVPLFGGLSADSVLLGSDGRTLVLDVAVTSAASSVETLGGNPERAAYAAPEQLGTAPRADARTDIFTAGVLLWELLACRRLFVGSDKAVAQKVLSSKIPRPDELRRKGDPEIPSALVGAVMKALERAPDARPASADAFAALLKDSGIEPADHAEVAGYVNALAEGAIQRARDALRSARAVMPRAATKPAAEPPAPAVRPPLPPRTPSPEERAEVKPALPERAEVKPALPERAEVKPAVPERAEAKPALPERAEVKPTLPARVDVKPALPARPDVKAMMMMPPRTEAKPAFPVRADVKPKIRARQATMIGIPAPAQSPVEPVPAQSPARPVPAAELGPTPGPAESAPVLTGAPPPFDTSDEEPTVQFTSRDLLRIEEMDRKSERVLGPPTEPPAADAPPSPADFPEPPTSPTPAEITNPSAPVDGGWLDDPASPPPPSRVDREALTPDDPTETALPPEPHREPIRPRAPVAITPPPAEAPIARAPDRPLMSKAPAALSVPPASMSQSPAYLPSQVPPPLIHDPRARGAARRAAAATDVAAHQASSGLGIGIALSIALALASAAVAIVVLRGQREEGAESPVVTAPAAASVALPAPGVSVDPAATPAPSATEPGAATPDAGNSPASAADEADDAPTLAPAPRPARASARPAPRSTKRAPKKKKARYVPDDI